MAGKLVGKVALITGTGGGQGRAAALRFASEGALVVGCDINVHGNEETVEQVRAGGGVMEGMAVVDLGDTGEAAHRVAQAASIHGRVDILCNNASSAVFAPMGIFPQVIGIAESEMN
jgi:NAD(P)-dependent dehydrogenase (short-subunit alcohol dehydrogenase family)